MAPSKVRDSVDMPSSNKNDVQNKSFIRPTPPPLSTSLPNVSNDKMLTNTNTSTSTIPSSSSSSSKPGLFSMVASTFTPRSLMNRNNSSSITMKGGGTVDTTGQSPNIPSSSTSNTNNNSATTATVCDKCDGKHLTENCPYFKKPREAHPDATSRGKGLGSIPSTLPGATLRNARVVRQPGDGSCLFHSLSYGLKDINANTLRAEICNYIINNPNMLIADSPISDWVKWDSGSSVVDYGRKMSRGAWGGGIEMAVVCKMKNVNVHVYEKQWDGSLKRISAFDTSVSPESRPIIRVLYCGGVHYGMLCYVLYN